MNSNNIANPAPLGLMGFGLSTILLNIHNAGFAQLSVAIVAMGIFYGGLAQFVAGLFEFKRGNTFGATAFTSYGLFWFSLVGIWLIPAIGSVVATPESFLGYYFAVWGIFTVFMFIGTLKASRGDQVVFATLSLLFILLSITKFTGSESLLHITGIEGIICGSSAVYVGVATIVNTQFGRTLLPIGEK